MELLSLFSKSLPLDSQPPNDPNNPRYTSPRSYGVYEIEDVNLSRKRYRCGNHPVRHTELVRKHGAVKCVALYFDRSLAQKLKNALNR